jgi:WD40 repeat protein
MAIIFLSHSSYDNVAAAEIKGALLANGYESVFLDIDENDGIHPGSHWREQLARRLRAADAVVYLGSSRSQRSVWCTAELAVAKALEKVILPLQLERDARHELLDEEQWIMFTSTADEAIRRLFDELEQSSDSFAHRRSWDDRRSPFPGLRPFSEADAGVFFGRDAAIDELVRTVDPVSLLDHRSLVVVVGASGAGKSSLVRAGVIPILASHRRHDATWFVVPPVVPGGDTMRELGRALVGAGAEPSVVDDLVGGARLDDVVEALSQTRDPPADRTLVVIDQAEELCGRPDRLDVLHSLLDCADRGARCRIVMTVREGFFTRLFDGIDVDGHVRTVPLAPLSREAMALVIEGPARRADLIIEPGFVSSVLDDVQTGEALPLLALALDRTYRSMVSDGTRRLSQDRYRAAGGVANAVAQQASEAVAHLHPDGESRAVRLLAGLVSVDENGQWTRRPHAVTERDDRDVLRALEEARLLVVEDHDGQQVATAAHSALFSAWPPLARALEARTDDLRRGHRLERDAREWDEGGRAPEVLPVGGRYRELAGWRGQQPEADLAPVVDDYLRAAGRVERRRRVRLGLLAASVATLLGVAAVLGVGQLRARARAGEAARLADARGLIGRAVTEPRFDLAFDLGLRALEKEQSPEVIQGLIGIAARDPAFRGYLEPAVPAAGRALSWTHEGDLLVGDGAGRVTSWSPTRRKLATFVDSGPLVRSVVSGPTTDWVAWADIAGHVYTDSGGRVTELSTQGGPAHRGVVSELVSVDDRSLVSAGVDGVVASWDVSDGRSRWSAPVGAPVTSAAKTPTGEAVVVGTIDGEVIEVSLSTGTVIDRSKVSDVAIRSLAGIDGGVLAGDDDGAIYLLQVTGPQGTLTGEAPPLYQGAGAVRALAVVDGDSFLTGWTDGIVRLVDRQGRMLRAFAAHDGPIRDVVLDARTRWFAATADDGLVSRWDLTGASLLVDRRLETNTDLVGAIDASGVIYFGGTDRQVSILPRHQASPRRLGTRFPTGVFDLDVTNDGTVLAVGQLDGTAVALSTADGKPLARLDVGPKRAWVALVGNLMIAAGSSIRVVDLSDGQETPISLPAGVQVTSLAADDDGRLIVIGGESDERGATLIVVNGDRHVTTTYFGTPGLAVNALDIDTRHHTMAVGRSDGKIEIWNIDPLRNSGVFFAGHTSEIYDLRYTDGARTVLSIDGAGRLWTWSAEFGTSSAQPIDTGLKRAWRVLPDPKGTHAAIVGLGGISDVNLDPKRIQQVACELTEQRCE